MEAVTIKRITEEELAKELRIQYIQNPPEGMTSDEVRDMSDEDLLDMDYFLRTCSLLYGGLFFFFQFRGMAIRRSAFFTSHAPAHPQAAPKMTPPRISVG